MFVNNSRFLFFIRFKECFLKSRQQWRNSFILKCRLLSLTKKAVSLHFLFFSHEWIKQKNASSSSVIHHTKTRRFWKKKMCFSVQELLKRNVLGWKPEKALNIKKEKSGREDLQQLRIIRYYIIQCKRSIFILLII